jgi:hypothetical protein
MPAYPAESTRGSWHAGCRHGQLVSFFTDLRKKPLCLTAGNLQPWSSACHFHKKTAENAKKSVAFCADYLVDELTGNLHALLTLYRMVATWTDVS